MLRELAENFAAALLMPAADMRARWTARHEQTDVHDWLNATAAHFRVSTVACKWRLHNLDCISKADLLDIDDRRLAIGSHMPVRGFSERFVHRIATALDAGRLSAKRTASLLAISLSDLAALLQSYGVEPSFEA